MAYKFQLGKARMSGSLLQEGDLNIAGGLQISGTVRVTSAGAGSFVALDATGLASLDGGVDVNGNATISTAGAIAGATSIDASGDLTVGSITNAEFTVDASGNTDIDGTLNVEGIPTFQAAAVFSAGIGTANAIAGATSIDGSGDLTMGTITMTGFAVDADGDTALKTLAVDDSSTIGCDSDGDIMTLAAQSLALASDVDFNVAKAGGLKLGGTSVSSTAAELNYLDNDGLSAARLGFLASVTAGTAAASKAVVLSSDADATGIRSLTGSGNFRAGGVYSDGALYAAGNAQFDGSMALGNATADNLQFNGSVASNFVPDADSSRNLGSDALRFATIYVDSIVGASVAWDVVICDGGDTISASAELALVRQGNGVTVTLPAATVGRNIRVKLSGGVGDVLVAPATNQLIEGQGAAIRLESTGSAITLCGVQGGGWSIL